MLTANTLLMGIIVVVSLMAMNNPILLQRLLMNPYRVDRDRQYYRFITSGFVHGGYMHLFFNMFALYMFGDHIVRIMEHRFGGIGIIYYWVFFVVGVIVADIPTYIQNKDKIQYQSLGASGGVSSVVFAFILFNPMQDLCLYGILCQPSFIFGTLYLIYSYYQSKGSRDNINHSAHLFGALFGIVVAIIIQPSVVVTFVEQISEWRIF